MARDVTSWGEGDDEEGASHCSCSCTDDAKFAVDLLSTRRPVAVGQWVGLTFHIEPQ